MKIITRENTRNKLLNYISSLMIEVNKLVILKYYKDLKSRQISTKASEDDFVTIADKESEEFIVRKLVGFLNINQKNINLCHGLLIQLMVLKTILKVKKNSAL